MFLGGIADKKCNDYLTLTEIGTITEYMYPPPDFIRHIEVPFLAKCQYDILASPESFY